MLEVSRGVLDRNKLGETNVHLIHADVRKWNFTNGGFDLIVTNFVLDCFPPHDLSAVTETIASIAAPNATWLVSDFCEPPVGPSKWRAQIILTMMYSFFQRATGIAAGRLVAPDSFLSGAGFTLQRRVYFDWGMLHSDLWEFRPRLSARSKFREQRHAAIHEKRHAMDVV
jgi:hypothetical protein